MGEEYVETWDINCIDCGKFILIEGWKRFGGDISCVAGSYYNGYYIPDGFLCRECAENVDLNMKMSNWWI